MGYVKYKALQVVLHLCVPGFAGLFRGGAKKSGEFSVEDR
jgi:hypothetical protein